MVVAQGGKQKENKHSTSFLKKRSKKLSTIGAGTAFEPAVSVLSLTDESFLVLFFKKERLAFVPLQRVDHPGR